NEVAGHKMRVLLLERPRRRTPLSRTEPAGGQEDGSKVYDCILPRRGQLLPRSPLAGPARPGLGAGRLRTLLVEVCGQKGCFEVARVLRRPEVQVARLDHRG